MAVVPAPPDPVFTLRGSSSPITYLKFSDPATNLLISGSEDGQVNIWDLKTHRSTGSIEACDGQSVLWIEFIRDDHLVTFGKDGIAQIWEAAESRWEKTGNFIS